MSSPSPAAADPCPGPCPLLSGFSIRLRRVGVGAALLRLRDPPYSLGGPRQSPGSATGCKPGEEAWGKGRALREGSDSLAKS
jgi:hypothetical protein